MGNKQFIIPAIDIINGAVVRLTKGDFGNRKKYSDDPLEVAKSFEAAGLQRLHLVDLDGAKAGKIQNLAVLETIAANTSLQVDFGGGIHAAGDVRAVLNAGAQKVTIGSLAVKNTALLQSMLEEFGAGKFFIGADVSAEKIKIGGWLQDTGISIFDFIPSMQDLGLNDFFCTDIQKDGAMQGTSVDLYKKIKTAFPSILLTASGGVSSVEDIQLAREAGCDAVIIGKAIYEGAISLAELEKLNN